MSPDDNIIFGYSFLIHVVMFNIIIYIDLKHNIHSRRIRQSHTVGLKLNPFYYWHHATVLYS
jgi:hypothetical protein